MTSRARESGPQSFQDDAGAASQAQRVFRFSAPLPPPECNPNHRKRWERIKANKAYRYEVGLCFRGAIVVQDVDDCSPYFERAILDLVFILPDQRRRDVDNLIASFKAGQDALVDVGLIPDDDSAHLQLGTVSARKMLAGERPEIRATLTEAR